MSYCPDCKQNIPIGGLAHTCPERREREAQAALDDAAELLAEIMRDEVNHQDEAEKWLRAYAPQHLFPENADVAASPPITAPKP